MDQNPREYTPHCRCGKGGGIDQWRMENDYLQMLDVNAEQGLQQANLVTVTRTRKGVQSRYCSRHRSHGDND